MYFVSQCVYFRLFARATNSQSYLTAHPRAKWLVGINGILSSTQSLGNPWAITNPQDAFACPGSASSWVAIAKCNAQENIMSTISSSTMRDGVTNWVSTTIPKRPSLLSSQDISCKRFNKENHEFPIWDTWVITTNSDYSADKLEVCFGFTSVALEQRCLLK